MARLFRSQKQIKGLNLPDEPMLKNYDQALIAERQKIESCRRTDVRRIYHTKIYFQMSKNSK